jgi:membrane fusion protein, peptide pheromone/bacteriocin exporter
LIQAMPIALDFSFPNIFMAELFYTYKQWEGSVLPHLMSINRRSQVIYFFILLIVLFSLGALPLIRLDVTVNTPGIIRPSTGKSLPRAMIAGRIDSVYVHDAQYVRAGDTLIVINNSDFTNKLLSTQTILRQVNIEIEDLQKLTTGHFTNRLNLQSSICMAQYLEMKQMLADADNKVAKAEHDYSVHQKLFAAGKVVSEQELLEKAFLLNNESRKRLLILSQHKSQWEEALSTKLLRRIELRSEESNLLRSISSAAVIAPVAGHVQQANALYRGAYVQTGESVCEISPVASVIVETMVRPQEMGFLYQNMPVKISVDAFDKNDWGYIDGKVTAIDKDILINDKHEPSFLVKCALMKTGFEMSSGRALELKKGLTVQVRFVLAKRSLWQLMNDRMINWTQAVGQRGGHHEEKG